MDKGKEVFATVSIPRNVEGYFLAKPLDGILKDEMVRVKCDLWGNRIKPIVGQVIAISIVPVIKDKLYFNASTVRPLTEEEILELIGKEASNESI